MRPAQAAATRTAELPLRAAAQACRARAAAAFGAVHRLSGAAVFLRDEDRCSRRSGRCTSAPISAAIPSRRCRRSTWATASWAMAWAPPGPRRSALMGASAPSRSWVTAGFWHNGLTSGIGNSVFNRHDDLTVIIDNGYSAATGGQDILVLARHRAHRKGNHSIVDAVKGIGVKWVKRTQHLRHEAGRSRCCARR